MTRQTEIPVIEVWTEGKTDWIHLKTAMRKLGIQLPLTFHEEDKPMGDDRLKKLCEMFAQRSNPTPMVFVFDRDKADIVSAVNDPHNLYKSWGNNVFSFAIPEPHHRKGYTNISIELYYTDNELKTVDNSGHRLYLTSEFNERSGKLKSDKYISVGNKGVLTKCTEPQAAKIVDTDVFDAIDKNVALSKAQFAEYIRCDAAPFHEFDFASFRPVFTILTQIVQATRQDRSVYLPEFEHLFRSLTENAPGYQLSMLFDILKRVIVLGLQLFVISTIRLYEDAIVNEPNEYRKKVKPIKTILGTRFFNPSLKSVFELTEKCFYLVDNTAPEPLQAMKQGLEEVFVLGAVGQMLDDLEKVFPPERGKPVRKNKALVQRSLIGYVIEEIAQYDNKSFADLEEGSESLLESTTISIATWKQALLQITSVLQSLFSRPIELRSLRSADPRTGDYTVEIYS